MPNIESARKQMRVSAKRRERNRAQKAALKTHLKRLDALLETKQVDTLKNAAVEAIRLIGKTRNKKVINRKRAARLQSRVQRRLNKALAPAGPEKTV